MNILDDIADSLNGLLHADQLDLSKLKSIFVKLPNKSPIGLIILDFNVYNENRLIQARDKKLICFSEGKFEEAAKARNEERECLNYIRFKKYFNVDKSLFYPEEYKLTFIYLGLTKNEQAIKNFLSNFDYIPTFY